MRTFLLLILAALSIGAVADEPKTDPTYSAAGAFFALSVADLEDSTRWYVEKLGLTVVMRPPKSGPASVAVLEGYGLIVELIQHDEARRLGDAAPGVADPFYVHGYFKAGAIVENYDALLAMVRERGVTIEHGPYAAKPGQRASVIIRDNAGNLIHLFNAKKGA